MRQLLAGVLALALPVALSGCMTLTPAAYMVSPDVKQSLSAYQGAHLHVDSISGPDVDLMCRAVGKVRIEHDLTVPEFVQKAFNDEFRYAGLDGSGGAHLTGRLTRIDFSSSSGAVNGYWDLALTLQSATGSALETSVHYEFESGFVGASACNNTGLALAQAAQALVRKTIADPRFPNLIGPRK